MMITASGTLASEAYHNVAEYHEPNTHIPVGLVSGMLLGLGFIKLTQNFLDEHEHLKFEGLEGLNAKKSLLIMGVMTLHSFTEGVRKISPPSPHPILPALRSSLVCFVCSLFLDWYRSVLRQLRLPQLRTPHLRDASRA
jgi:hypothetical protein